MKSFCLAICVFVLLPAAATAGAEDVGAVMAKTRQRIEASDFRASGRLIQVSGSGDRRSYKFVMKAHWFPDGLRLLCEVTEPAASRVQLLLQMDARGRMTIKTTHPGSQTLTALPFEEWKDGLLGTGFSFEDLVEGQFFWKDQEMLPETKYGARDCTVLKSTPGPADRTHYGAVTSYLDRQIYFPVFVVKTPRGSGPPKDFTYFGLRQTNGVWSASQIEVKIPGKAGSSLLIIERGSAVAKLERKDFDLASPDLKEK